MIKQFQINIICDLLTAEVLRFFHRRKKIYTPKTNVVIRSKLFNRKH